MQKLFVFNPTVDLELANGSAFYHPPKPLLSFSHDLEGLMFWLGNKEDTVFLHRKPSSHFLSLLKQKLGIEAHYVINKTDLKAVDSVVPWGWSAYIQDQFKGYGATFPTVKEIKQLASRSTSMVLLDALLTQHSFDGLGHHLPQICRSIGEVNAFMKVHGSMVLKLPHSSSGRGNQVLRKTQLNQSNIQWIRGAIADQGFVMAEKLLPKKYDISFHFYSDGKDIEFISTTHFKTNANGQYQFTYIGDALSSVEQDDVEVVKSLLISTQKSLHRLFTQQNLHKKYVGYFGVDALIYTSNDELKIQAIVEINFRYTMGLASCLAAKKLGLKQGAFKIEQLTPELKETLSTKPNYIPLTDVWNANRFVAYMIVG